MKAKFKIGESIVCVAEVWCFSGTTIHYLDGPKYHEVVTVAGHILRDNGEVGLVLAEYIDPDKLGWRESGFEKLVSDRVLIEELSSITVGNCSAEASLNYTRWFTMQLKGKRFVFDKEEPRSKKPVK